MYFKVDVPKRYKSCKWNNMIVEKIGVLNEEKGLILTKNKKGKILSFHFKWLVPIEKNKVD